MRKKLKDTGGLTMVELLCATAILVLLILMMNTGINMAVRSYRNITAESEVELLVSTLTDALTDKLRYCVVTETRNAETDALNKREIFISEKKEIGREAEVALSNVVEVVTAEGDPKKGQVKVDGKALLPDGAYGTKEAYIGRYMVESKDAAGNDVPPVTYHSDTNTFTVKFTVKSEETDITRTADLTVRCLNPINIEKEG